MEPFGIEVDGWQYIFDPSKPVNKGLQVVPKDQIATPDFLYKYYSLSNLNIEALKNNYLYASNRFEMNDDFDCLEQLIDMNDLTDEYIYQFYQKHHEDIDFIKDNFDSLKVDFPRNKAINYYGGFGVVSLSENLYSPTMWAHYSNSNHGFAVKFNLENFHERMLGPFPIRYRSDWFPLRLSEVDERFAFLHMTIIKSIDWKYEKEWRYIGVRPNMSYPPYIVDPELVEKRKFSYSPKAIEEIILGSRFFNETVKENIERKRLIIEPSLSKMNGTSKVDLLEIITNKILKTSWIVPKENSKTFELDSRQVEISRIDESLFEVRL